MQSTLLSILICSVLMVSCAGSKPAHKAVARPTTSEVMRDLSEFWKMDSLGSNGFRLYTYQQVLNSRPDSLYQGQMLALFGTPNITKKSNKGTHYYYYIWDSKAIPSEKANPSIVRWITILFGTNDKYATYIMEGHGDY